MKVILYALAAALFLWINALAIPPDTLDFGFAKFIKAREKLSHETVKQVCLKHNGTDAYPSALVFLDKISFLDKKGRETKRDSFPDTTGVTVAESEYGEYIYVFGGVTGKTGGFHRLYTFNGKTILKKQATEPLDKIGFGTPLEGPKEFLWAGSGRVALTKFDGKPVIEKEILDPTLSEDGDIYAVSGPNDRQIFVAANKYIIPMGQTISDRPILYGFDSQFNEIFRDTLGTLLVNSFKRSGKYLSAPNESDTARTVMIFDLSGTMVNNFDNPQAVIFSANCEYAVHIPRSGPIQVLSAADWKPIYVPFAMTSYSWIDAAISDDGALGILYDGSALALLDIRNKSFKKIDYPFAFKTCRLYANGQKLILSGEFGFEVYEKAK